MIGQVEPFADYVEAAVSLVGIYGNEAAAIGAEIVKDAVLCCEAEEAANAMLMSKRIELLLE